MKILIVAQHYKPEPFRLSDIAESLVQKGHEVTVVTGVPNYPEGIIYDGYRHGQKRYEVINGVRVYRSYTIGRRKNVLFRFLNYYSYAISSSLNVLLNRYKAEDRGDFDVVFLQQTSPVMLAYAGLLYKWKHKVPVLLNCLDLWPESLQAGGVTESSLLYRYYHGVARRIYRACDRILLPSRSYAPYMKEEFGLTSERLVYVPQYAEDLFGEVSKPSSVDKVRLLFAGNIGSAQGLDVVLEAAALLKDEPVQFDIVGDGSELVHLKKRAHQLEVTSSVVFHGRKPLEEMPAYYSEASAFLVTLKDLPGMNRVLPGKVQSYMASGKPLIASINGETATVIQASHTGLVSPAEDAAALAANIREFIVMSDDERREMGRKARLTYDHHFTKERVLAQIEQQLVAVTAH